MLITTETDSMPLNHTYLNGKFVFCICFITTKKITKYINKSKLIC